jgi:hypothetical protein
MINCQFSIIIAVGTYKVCRAANSAANLIGSHCALIIEHFVFIFFRCLRVQETLNGGMYLSRLSSSSAALASFSYLLL